MSKRNAGLKPNWLVELQFKSWEPEILLSGIVLYGMFKVPDALDHFLIFFSRQVYNYINAMDTLVATLKIGIYWLITGLILHLICRGLWVGLIGLSYAFPKGINLKKLKFQPKYMTKAKAVPPIEEVIIKLEEVCSFIYSISFLLFMSLLGSNIYIMVVIVIPLAITIGIFDAFSSVDEGLIGVLNVYANWVMLFGLLGVVDFLTMGYFRRFRILAKIYWPFYLTFNFLSLSNFYRPTYFTLITNLNKWALFFFLSVFVFLSSIGMLSVRKREAEEYFSRIEIWNTEEGNIAREEFYQDKESPWPSSRIQIPSDIIKGDVLKVFIPVRIEMEDSLKKFMKYDSISKIEDSAVNIGQYYLENMTQFYQLTVADSTYRTKGYFQKVTSTNQKGYLTYLNISFLEEGLYELTLKGPNDMFEKPFATVPFYKVD